MHKINRLFHNASNQRAYFHNFISQFISLFFFFVLVCTQKYRVESLANRTTQFVRNNGFYFVFIPFLAVAHWAWFRLQDNELFVPRHLKKGHPFFDGKFTERVKKLFPSKDEEAASSE